MEIFELKRPVTFEGHKFEQLDLSGLEDLTGEEYATLLKEAERIDGADMVPEKSLTFAFLAAATTSSMSPPSSSARRYMSSSMDGSAQSSESIK